MILIINGGSSSIKFAAFNSQRYPEKLFSGQIQSIGITGTSFQYGMNGKVTKQFLPDGSNDYPAAIAFLMSWLGNHAGSKPFTAIGHRVVHGMGEKGPVEITEEKLTAWKAAETPDPDHLPAALKLINECRKNYPGIMQFACFDTDFHQHMPRIARQLAIPRRFEEQGIIRYGFHGLSYNYIVYTLRIQEEAVAFPERLIIAHLGNGASLAAILRGSSIDTSMGFTPCSGIPMSTRPGDLDPGAVALMMKSENLSADQFNHMINHESGLLGMSQTSGNMQTLLVQETSDMRSLEAVNFFCYQVKKWIGAFAAVLGGLNTLVFTGGIGEHASAIRTRICDGLSFLGIELDEAQNNRHAGIISTTAATVQVRVMPTDEEWMIAKLVADIIPHTTQHNSDNK